jgi:CheY-like chemotaxis protein
VLIWRCGQAGSVPGPWSIPAHFVRPETMRDVVRRARQRQRVKTPVLEPTALPGFTGARVLVVDDNPINLRLAERMLSKQGCTVTRASDGHEALELVRNAAFELVLMDCNMPGMDGLEATRQIRALERAEGRSRLATVALTADAMQSERDECVRAGMNDHVTKPVREERLREVLSHFIGRPTLATG